MTCILPLLQNEICDDQMTLLEKEMSDSYV